MISYLIAEKAVKTCLAEVSRSTKLPNERPARFSKKTIERLTHHVQQVSLLYESLGGLNNHLSRQVIAMTVHFGIITMKVRPEAPKIEPPKNYLERCVEEAIQATKKFQEEQK